VTSSEARQILGVSEHASEQEIRRAYLRRVAEHRPEQDPEGFQRVRQAYETLRDGVDPGGAGEPDEPVDPGSRVPEPPPSRPRPSRPERPAGPDPRALQLDAVDRAREGEAWEAGRLAYAALEAMELHLHGDLLSMDAQHRVVLALLADRHAVEARALLDRARDLEEALGLRLRLESSLQLRDVTTELTELASDLPGPAVGTLARAVLHAEPRAASWALRRLRPDQLQQLRTQAPATTGYLAESFPAQGWVDRDEAELMPGGRILMIIFAILATSLVAAGLAIARYYLDASDPRPGPDYDQIVEELLEQQRQPEPEPEPGLEPGGHTDPSGQGSP